MPGNQVMNIWKQWMVIGTGKKWQRNEAGEFLCTHMHKVWIWKTLKEGTKTNYLTSGIRQNLTSQSQR